MCARGLEGWSCLGRDELEAAAAHIAENGVRLFVLMIAVEVDVLAHVRVGGEEVFETIVIKVERADTPPCQLSGGKSDAGLPGDIGEEPAADVAAQREGLLGEGREDQEEHTSELQSPKDLVCRLL